MRVLPAISPEVPQHRLLPRKPSLAPGAIIDYCRSWAQPGVALETLRWTYKDSIIEGCLFRDHNPLPHPQAIGRTETLMLIDTQDY